MLPQPLIQCDLYLLTTIQNKSLYILIIQVYLEQRLSK